MKQEQNAPRSGPASSSIVTQELTPQTFLAGSTFEDTHCAAVLCNHIDLAVILHKVPENQPQKRQKAVQQAVLPTDNSSHQSHPSSTLNYDTTTTMADPSPRHHAMVEFLGTFPTLSGAPPTDLTDLSDGVALFEVLSEM